MNDNNHLLGYYNYTVILTYVGVLTGFFGILCCFKGNVFEAVICLMVAGFCDMFDGTVASTMERNEQEKTFGIQIDSLADLICFGVLPATILFSLNPNSMLCMAVALLAVLCALIRLAFFNVDEQQRQLTSAEPRSIYYGLPVTLAAVFVPIAFALEHFFPLRPGTIVLFTMLIMALMFVIPFKIKKPKMLGKCAFIICGVAEIALLIASGSFM